MTHIRIPRDRIAVLIGKGGRVKRDIEKKASCELIIDEGSVEIRGEGMGAWLARDIVQAIARGFNPELALRLLNDEFSFELIRLEEFGKGDKDLKGKKGRIIGEKGKARRVIEDLADVNISVYGKTVSIIGPYDGVQLAKEAVLRLLGGSRHSSVYRFLENARGPVARP